VNSLFCPNKYGFWPRKYKRYRAHLYDITESMSLSHKSYRATLQPTKWKKRGKPDTFAREIKKGMCTIPFTIWDIFSYYNSFNVKRSKLLLAIFVSLTRNRIE